jgi:drug/metabolite transporter (DMT)-like permease
MQHLFQMPACGILLSAGSTGFSLSARPVKHKNRARAGSLCHQTMPVQTDLSTSSSADTRALPAYLALIAGIICIAWSAIFVRWTDIPGPASAFYRMLFPALVLLPTHFFDRSRSPVSARTLGIIAFGGLFFALDLALYNTSILKTSAANATLLGNNTPIVVGLITWLVFRKRPAAGFWIGLLLALSGTLVIVWADLSRHVRFGAASSEKNVGPR